MTTAERQPKGIPTGGQFAASTHAEPGVALTTPNRRPELEGWPAHLADPDVSFRVTDEGKILTSVTDPSGDFIEVWEKDDGSGGYDGHALGEWEGSNDDDIEQAQEWLTERHKVIVSAVRAEEKAAVERARARILGQATGIAKPATNDEMAAAIELNGATARQALRDMELGSASLAARKILETHPQAVHADIRTDSWDNGEFVAGAIVRDAGGNRLAEYLEDGDDEAEIEAHKEVVSLLKNLDAEPQNAHWSEFSTGSYEDRYTIDVKKAAAWTPAGDAVPAAVPVTPTDPAPAAYAEERPCTDGPWCAAPRGKHVDGCNMESS